jgi:hypothetical protein
MTVSILYALFCADMPLPMITLRDVVWLCILVVVLTYLLRCIHEYYYLKNEIEHWKDNEKTQSSYHD